MKRVAYVLAVTALTAPIACRTSGDATLTVRAAATGSSIEAALDQCQSAKAPPDTTDASRQHPRLAGRVRSYDRFSIWVPDRARVSVDTATRAVGMAWPDCEKCRFSVSVQRDTVPGGLEERVARIVASQKKIDSINRDPNTTAAEFDDIDGPPQPFTTAAGRGYLIDDSCGDCAATTVFFGRRSWIAEIGFGSDDDTPDGGRHECEMQAVAKSFLWRE